MPVYYDNLDHLRPNIQKKYLFLTFNDENTFDQIFIIPRNRQRQEFSSCVDIDRSVVSPSSLDILKRKELASCIVVTTPIDSSLKIDFNSRNTEESWTCVGKDLVPSGSLKWDRLEYPESLKNIESNVNQILKDTSTSFRDGV